MTSALLIFVFSGIFHYAVGYVSCDTGIGFIETTNNFNHTFHLPELSEIIIGFKVSDNTSIHVNLYTAENEGRGQRSKSYGKSKDWRFFRITKEEYRIPSDKTITLKTMNITTLVGRKFAVSSSETVCWRMFLPCGKVECELPPPASEQPGCPTPDPEQHRNDSTICKISPNRENISTITLILIAAVSVLVALLSGLICYLHHLKKQVKRAQEGKQTITNNPANQTTHFNTRNATGAVSDATAGRPNSAHESENSIYGAIIR